jgi:hypothetical protein
MTGTTRAAAGITAHSSTLVLLLAFAIFGLLWVLYMPWRDLYIPPDGDTIPLLADGSLLAPAARWQDWFTRGYSHFWDFYPDWQGLAPLSYTTAFTRPAFQFVIYLAHFVLGRQWAAYQIINNFAVAGVCAAAFHIAHAALGLRTGLSLVAAILVLLSPPVLYAWWLGVGFAIEPLATILVAGAFLAIIARRDLLCLGLLFLALLTKENALWAPLAAAITVLLRSKPDESVGRRILTAASMLLPVAMWLGLRLAFFGGIGGTYATMGYTPFIGFLKLTFDKITHVHYLLVSHSPGRVPDDRETVAVILDRTTALLIWILIPLSVLRMFSESVNHVRHTMHEEQWKTVDATLLVVLWAAIALAFDLALPIRNERYGTSIVVFAWPVLIAEVERRGKVIIWLALAGCCILSVTRSSHMYLERIARPPPDYRDYRSMIAVLRQAPHGTRQIYVLSTGGMLAANPEHVRLAFGLPAQIVRVAEINWNCPATTDLVGFDYQVTDRLVNMAVILPTCANFYFANRIRVEDGRIHRNEAISYEVPESQPLENAWWDVGRRMIVHVHPDGPARFVVEHGGPDGIAWFDTPRL